MRVAFLISIFSWLFLTLNLLAHLTGFFCIAHVAWSAFSKMINWKTWMVWWSLLFSVTTAEFFTSLSRIKGLVRLESALSNSLDNYLEQMSEPPEVLRQFADRVRKEMKIAAGDIEKYAFHPINSFLLVRRFVRHWTELATFLSEGSPNGKETAAVGCKRISTSPYCHPTYPVC